MRHCGGGALQASREMQVWFVTKDMKKNILGISLHIFPVTTSRTGKIQSHKGWWCARELAKQSTKCGGGIGIAWQWGIEAEARSFICHQGYEEEYTPHIFVHFSCHYKWNWKNPKSQRMMMWKRASEAKHQMWRQQWYSVVMRHCGRGVPQDSRGMQAWFVTKDMKKNIVGISLYIFPVTTSGTGKIQSHKGWWCARELAKQSTKCGSSSGTAWQWGTAARRRRAVSFKRNARVAELSFLTMNALFKRN